MNKTYLKPEIKTIDITLTKLLSGSLTIPVNTDSDDPPIENPEEVW